jgi:hypothetical protein
MSEERKDQTYGRLIREFRELQTDVAASDSELKRIGENFIGLGDCLVKRPGLHCLDEPNFQADTSALLGLLRQHDALVTRLTGKEAELLTHGPIPRFD